MSRQVVSAALALGLVCAPSVATAQGATPQSAKTTFRSAVDVVSVAAVVRDKRGRFAGHLTKDDFVVEEGGARRDIVQFRADINAPVRVALLFDVSGSMRISDRIEEARQAARHLLGALRLGVAAGEAPWPPGPLRAPSGGEAAALTLHMDPQAPQPFPVAPRRSE